MKEIIIAVIGGIKDFLALSLRHILVIALLVASFAYATLLLPESVFEFHRIGHLRTDNLDKIGALAYTAAFILIFGLLYKFASCIHNVLSAKSKRGREGRRVEDVINSLSPEALQYLQQFPRNRTTLIRFDETDPVVALLNENGLIRRSSARVPISGIVRFECTRTSGQLFEIPAKTYDYLTRHPELFDELSCYA